MMPYTIYYDLDGTLLGRSRILHPDTKAALQRTRENGNRIFMCSGRSPKYLLKGICKELDFDGIVACAGGYVSIFEEDPARPGLRVERRIFENRIDTGLLQTIMEAFERAGILYEFETGNGIYVKPETDQSFDDLLIRLFRSSEKEIRQRREESRSDWENGINIDFREWNIDIPVPKLIFIAPDRAAFEPLIPMLEQHFKFNYFFRTEDVATGELIPIECTKKRGMEAVAAYYGETMEHTVGFGDSMNDLEMIEAAGIGVVFEHAPKALLDTASHTFIDPDQGGIARAMRELGLD